MSAIDDDKESLGGKDHTGFPIAIGLVIWFWTVVVLGVTGVLYKIWILAITQISIWFS